MTCKMAGVDEVGRGCIAGPVFAAAVILNSNIADEFVQASEEASYSSNSRPTVVEGDVPSVYVTGIGEGKLIFAKPGDSDDILPELSARMDRSSSNMDGRRVMIDLHNQEGWGRPPLAAGSKEGTMLEISASKALKLSSSSSAGARARCGQRCDGPT